MSKRVPLDEALATARANKFGRMAGRGRDNRLEPECWPHVDPSFEFTKDQKFFAIGSCFAQNISKRLALDGYNVLSPTVTHGERRIRFTPPSICQEISWARNIYDRDDQVRDEDVQPLLLETGNGDWADIWSRPETGASTDLAATIARRKALYSYFRGAFEADVIIITLGLIEAWWDEISQSYVEFDTPWTRRSDRGRFKFERLSFETCRDYVDRTLKLVLDGKRRVLITTSPVILGRTFTDQDILLANTHSKSVLRAVVGELADAYVGVDYFPSYEIATLTRRPEVWEDDLIHIQPNFIARIMQHVTKAYVPGSSGPDDAALMKMANLVEALQFDAARHIYDASSDVIWDSVDPAVHIAAMRLAANAADAEIAVRHALRVECEDALLYRNHADWMFDVSRVLSRSADYSEQGKRIALRLLDFCTADPELFGRIFGELQRMGDDNALRELISLIGEADVNHPVLMHKVCAKLYEFGQVEEALALAKRQLERTPDHGLMLARQARLLLALGRLTEAVESLDRLRTVEPENGWAHLTLARTLHKARREAEAVEAVDVMLQRVPDDARGLALKARLLAKLGRHTDAREAAEAATRAAGSDPAILREMGPLLNRAAA